MEDEDVFDDDESYVDPENEGDEDEDESETEEE